jgi:hypothetical protein
MGKEEGKKLTKRGLPKPLQRRGCAWRDTCFLLRGKGFGAV